MNYFGWIDFSRRDREIARDIIASLNEPGAVDELGIGVIRDAFSDYFFPGTSTIQTIAKYFFLVSYQLEELTKSPHSKPEVELRKMEQNCSLAMWDSLSPEEQQKEGVGIFGRTFFEVRSKDWVKRTPSTVYWSGIRKLGLLECDNKALSLADFLRISRNQEMSPHESDEELNKTNHAGFEKSWHWNLPSSEMRGDWMHHPSVKLTDGEDDFFMKQIKKKLPDSMLAFLIDFRDKLPPNFSDLDKLLPENLKVTWQLANNFSEFIKPAQIRFNFLLGNKKAIQAWNDYPAQRLSDLANLVNLSDIFDLLKIEKHFQLRCFLEKLKRIYTTANTSDFDDLLVEREKQLKSPSRMKLGKKNPYYQEVWVGGLGLQYRYPDACRLLCKDVDAGEVQ